MAQVAILGLSNFGYYLALKLTQMGSEVMVIDHKKELIDRIKNDVSKAIIADATDRRALEKLGLENMDAVVISLGDRLESSILCAFYLKEMKVKNIVAKALSEDHKRILEMIGVNKVVFPEKESGERLAMSIHRPEILEYIPMGRDMSMIEMEPFKEMVGKTIRELDFRKRYGCQIIAIRPRKGERELKLPDPDQVIEKENILIIMGQTKSIEELERRRK